MHGTSRLENSKEKEKTHQHKHQQQSPLERPGAMDEGLAWEVQDALRERGEEACGVAGQVCALRWDALAEDFAPLAASAVDGGASSDGERAQLAELRQAVRSTLI